MSMEKIQALHLRNAEAIGNVHYKKPLYGLIANILPEQLARVIPGPEKRQENTNG
jgi:hypothetical protein